MTFPRHRDNFIKLNLIKEQTAFKTNLKSMNVHTPPPRILMAATLYLPNPFYPGLSSLRRGNGLIGFLRPSRAGGRLGGCVCSPDLLGSAGRAAVPAPMRRRLWGEAGV